MAGERTREEECEVLVVGAGPTGLMAAGLLRRGGVHVRIVEQRAEASRESRAFAVVARSMELLRQLGLVEALLDQGVVTPGIDFYVGGDRVGGLDYDHAASPDTPYPFLLLHPQSKTEAVLIAELSRLGLEVERQVTVTHVELHPDGVVTHARRADGAELRIRSAYVVGADGAHSIVRKSLGLSFEGASYSQTFLLADCRVGWPEDRPLDHARFRVFMHGSSIALFLPLDGASRSRVMATDHGSRAEGGGAEAERLELPELESAFAQASGMSVRLTDPTWTTRYRVHHRSVSHYGRGRAFVAGDAAHIHSPAGGQGMNTGLQDAANLAWKLAAVLRRGAPADLLDTYDSERRPVGAQVVATSDKLFTMAAGQTGWEATVRDWLARPAAAAVSRLGSLQHQAFRKLSQLEIAYAPGRYVEDAAPALGERGARVGHRAPDAAIAHHRSVFDLTSGYGFTVLALSRKPLEHDERQRIADALETLSHEGVAAHLLTRTAVGRDPRTVFVSSPEVFDTYGVRERDGQALYAIRPDGYVGWRAEGLDLAGCRQFLNRFGRGGQGHG